MSGGIFAVMIAMLFTNIVFVYLWLDERKKSREVFSVPEIREKNGQRTSEGLCKAVRNFCYIHGISKNEADDIVIDVSRMKPRAVKGYGLS